VRHFLKLLTLIFYVSFVGVLIEVSDKELNIKNIDNVCGEVYELI